MTDSNTSASISRKEELLALLMAVYKEETGKDYDLDKVHSVYVIGYKEDEANSTQFPLTVLQPKKELITMLTTETPENNDTPSNENQQAAAASVATNATAKEAIMNRKGVWFCIGVLSAVAISAIAGSLMSRNKQQDAETIVE